MTDLRTVRASRPSPDLADCDFCNGLSARWAYPAKDFEVARHFNDGRTLTVRSQGAWAACDECSGLIETGDDNGLALRAHKSPSRPPLHAVRQPGSRGRSCTGA